MSADSPVALYAIAQLKGKLKLAGKSFEVAPYGASRSIRETNSARRSGAAVHHR
jgi:hypothetical protein